MKVIVLGAGKGTRLLQPGEDFPKVMKPMKGKPLLGHVLSALNFVDIKDILVVVGYHKEKVMAAFPEYTAVVQEEQLGTGHAVKVCEEALAGYDGPVMVCLGDMPMFRTETYQNMLSTHLEQHNDCTILTAVSERKMPYGRIIRDEAGKFFGVVEQKDCTLQQLAIKELNPSIYVFDAKKMFAGLNELKNSNVQKEYYLTDLPKIMMDKGWKVGTETIHDEVQILGVNTLEDLALCESYL